MTTTYKYLGDRLTDVSLKGTECTAVRRINGKCIRGKNGTMLVSFNGKHTIIIGRLLRKIRTEG
jgi:hypothetical protein